MQNARNAKGVLENAKGGEVCVYVCVCKVFIKMGV